MGILSLSFHAHRLCDSLCLPCISSDVGCHIARPSSGHISACPGGSAAGAPYPKCRFPDACGCQEETGQGADMCGACIASVPLLCTHSCLVHVLPPCIPAPLHGGWLLRCRPRPAVQSLHWHVLWLEEDKDHHVELIMKSLASTAHHRLLSTLSDPGQAHVHALQRSGDNELETGGCFVTWAFCIYHSVNRSE